VVVQCEVHATPPPQVRMVYLVPSDRQVVKAHTAAIERAIRSIQIFYGIQVDARLSFRLHSPVVEVLKTTHETKWYQSNPAGFWENALADGFAHGGFNDEANRWIFYIDADPVCNQPGGIRTGGTNGVAVLPKNDLRGLIGQPSIPICPGDHTDPPNFKCRWIGGLGHELGHAFGLDHPPGCEPVTGPNCPVKALMWLGYTTYPDTFLLAQDISRLKLSQFFGPQNVPSKLPDCH
jgi:hypothetical protein